jgi:hypothetical protein
VRIPRSGRLVIRIANHNSFAVSANLLLRTVGHISHGHQVRFASTDVALPAKGSKLVTLAVSSGNRALLRKRHGAYSYLTALVHNAQGERRLTEWTFSLFAE